MVIDKSRCQSDLQKYIIHGYYDDLGVLQYIVDHVSYTEVPTIHKLMQHD